MDDFPVTNESLGKPMSAENIALTSVASMTQNFGPVKNICAHFNAFHAYAEDPRRYIETNHYCSHVNNDVRQCQLYDSTGPGARLIGIEYMISPELYESLPSDERRLWHSHVYEVKSGMLIMPNPTVPQVAWQLGEKREMEQVITLYGKVYHLWQTDKGHKLPLGEPKLMTSFTADGQLDFAEVEKRDQKFSTDYRKNKLARSNIPSPKIHPDADSTWAKP